MENVTPPVEEDEGFTNSPRNANAPLAQSGVHAPGQMMENQSSVAIDNQFSAVHRQLVRYRSFLTYNTIFTVVFNMIFVQFLW